jgi:hypothetical protein
MAEREGFEPSDGFDSITGLANQRTRPLCDLSIRIFNIKSITLSYAGL